LFGRFKRHADLQELCSDGEMFFHVSQQIGVGPEQNFTYVSTLTRKMAFVVDIRHEEKCFLGAIFATKPDPLKPAEIRHSLFQSASACGKFVARIVRRNPDIALDENVPDVKEKRSGQSRTTR